MLCISIGQSEGGCASQRMAVLTVTLFVCTAHGKLPTALAKRLALNFAPAAIGM